MQQENKPKLVIKNFSFSQDMVLRKVMGIRNVNLMRKIKQGEPEEKC